MFFVAEYFNLIMHNFVYWLEGKMWGASGPPPPLIDLGIIAFAGIFPLSYSWLVGFFLYLLIGMVLILCLGRLLLNNVPWGCPETVLEKREGETAALRTCCIPVPFVYICKRACQVLTIGLVLRVLSFLFTLEPNPADYCHPPFWDPPDALLEILGRIEIVGSCGDLLFSAHTLHAMAMMLTVLRHAPGLYLVTGLAVASMVMVVISMLAFKNHYSHDIVTGRAPWEEKEGGKIYGGKHGEGHGMPYVVSRTNHVALPHTFLKRTLSLFPLPFLFYRPHCVSHIHKRPPLDADAGADRRRLRPFESRAASG
jgi:hypothetical protein